MTARRARLLSLAEVQARLARGDRLHMELRNGSRLWWFENPLATVPDRVMEVILRSREGRAALAEAGDSLFGRYSI